MKTKMFAVMAFLTTPGAAVPFTAGAGGDPCAFCDAIYAECIANGGTRLAGRNTSSAPMHSAA